MKRVPAEFLKRIPKADLHVHLDGSLRLSTLIELAKKEGVELPDYTEKGLRQKVFKDKYASLVEYLKGFSYTGAVMQNAENIERIAYELGQDAIAEGVRYLEVRFAPQLHTRKGMAQCDAVEAVLSGLREALAECPSIQAGILLCAMCIGSEKANEAENLLTVELAKEFLGQGVVGVDLAGAEGIVPQKLDSRAFLKAVAARMQ